MHEILKDRIWRKLEALPQDQVYQVLDYLEFLEAKYAKQQAARPDALQKFAERVEDSLRMRSVAPRVISGTVGLLGTAHRVMRTVSDAGRGILGEPAPGVRAPSPSTPAARGADPPQSPAAAVPQSGMQRNDGSA
ncbi:MAG: DUF2281 domain-containing protein [Gemmatimonadota bacterium]